MENKKKKAEGILPKKSWLRKNGLTGLNACIYKHPELFSHIEQENHYKPLSEWIDIAEKLCSKHGGILPNRQWMDKNNYSRLGAVIYEKPESFRHLERKKVRNTSSEYRQKVAYFAKQNGGVIPSLDWFNKNGHGLVGKYIRQHPDKFQDFKQDKTYKSLNEWVQIADQLMADYGYLPNSKLLRDKGYNGLISQMKKNPEKFSHIKQKKLLKTVDDWVKEAEKLVKKNGGLLPPNSWLRENDLFGLMNMLRVYPEKFSHIKQEKRYKTINELVKLAEKIVKENDGVLPHISELERSEYKTLKACLYRYPSAFKGIKQYYFDRDKKRRIKIIGEE